MLKVDVFGIAVHQKKREKATEKFFRKRKEIELEFLLRKILFLDPVWPSHLWPRPALLQPAVLGGGVDGARPALVPG
jgi:hypothetical protein